MQKFVIHVYNDKGYDTKTIITYSKEELREAVSQLKKDGYTPMRGQCFPCRVYSVK